MQISRIRLSDKTSRRLRVRRGREPDRNNLLDAIVTFERSLTTPGSRFDRWLAGDAGAITAEELSGYQLFKSLGCISCHQGVNVGGNLFQRHGIFHPLGSPNPELVRVPSLRNVAATPPYFHDGSSATLPEAVKAMGFAQLDRVLTNEQVAAIVAFLNTLTGTYKGGAGHFSRHRTRRSSAMRLVTAAVGVLLLLALLTWLLLRGIDTNARSYAGTLQTFDEFALGEASLQRDVLQARAGLLRDYDPVGAAEDAMEKAAAQLRAYAGSLSPALVDRLGAAVAQQEELTERFKSGNALLQNSLTYVGLLKHRSGLRLHSSRPHRGQ